MSFDKGALLKKLRLKYGYTLDYVGQHIDVSRQTLYKYENNIVTNIPYDKIELLAKMYGVSPSFIMGWEQQDKNINNMNKEIGQRIRKIRKANKLTLLEVAHKMGLSEGNVQRYEIGKIENFALSTLTKFAKVLNTTPEELLGWVDKEDVTNSFDYSYVDEPVSAGLPENIEAIKNLPKIPIADVFMGKYARKQDILIMRVNGESMNKVISNGALIAVKTNIELSNITNGDIVVFTYNGEYAVKKYYDMDKFIMLRPSSNDLRFTDLIINKEDTNELRIIGKVVMYNIVLE